MMYSNLKAIVILGIILLWGCDKGVDVSDVFNFEVVENQGVNPDLINEPVGLSFTLEEQSDDNASYTMSFTSSGDGSFTYNNRMYAAGDEIALGTNPKIFSGYYTGSTSGEHEIVFTIVSSTTIVRQHKVMIPYINADFEVNMVYPESNYTGEVARIDMGLIDETPMEYTLSYTISPNDGSTLVKNGDVVAQGSVLKSGLNTLDFDFATVGEYSISFIITNHLGIQRIKTADITVEHTPFTFKAEHPGKIPWKETTHFKFTLEGHDNLIYVLTRKVSGGQGTFYFDNNLVIEQGTTTGAFKTKDTNPQTFTFRVTDNFGHSEEVKPRIGIDLTP